MAGLSLSAIRIALAAQIADYVARGTTGHAYDPGEHTYPAVVVRCADSEYVSYFESMSANGYAMVNLVVDIEVAAANIASGQKTIDDYLSAGTADTSSVFDAIRSDKTLGGLVADCIPRFADGPTDLEADPLVARMYVEIHVKKIGAQP